MSFKIFSVEELTAVVCLIKSSQTSIIRLILIKSEPTSNRMLASQVRIVDASNELIKIYHINN